MIRLMIIRHAKSSWKDTSLIDHERPLNKRGKRDAPRIAAHLAELGWTPDLVISSDATRAQDTWRRMTGVFSDTTLELTSELYHSSIQTVAEVVAAVDTAETVAIIGHNPLWEELVEWLSDEEVRMTTCNAVLLTSDNLSWETAMSAPGRWNVVDVIRPKELPT